VVTDISGGAGYEHRGVLVGEFHGSTQNNQEADMMHSNPSSTAKIFGHPIHPMLIPFPIAFFVATFAADLVYLSEGDTGWASAAMWLLGAGLVMAALAAVAGLTDFLGDRRVRAIRAAWWHMIGNVIAVVLELVNFYLRYTQGAAEAVAPAGALLSGIVVLLLLFTGWKGWELVYRHRVAVSDADETDLAQTRSL
jgi:uncharacterized membrane protein